MNRNKIIQFLLLYLNGIRYHSDFTDELTKIICGSGYEQKFFAILVARLSILSELGEEAISHKEFERITKELYSMHLTGRDFNIRILYAFLPNNEPVLLLPFYERAGKRKTDYTPYIEAALARFAAMKEG